MCMYTLHCKSKKKARYVNHVYIHYRTTVKFLLLVQLHCQEKVPFTHVFSLCLIVYHCMLRFNRIVVSMFHTLLLLSSDTQAGQNNENSSVGFSLCNCTLFL